MNKLQTMAQLKRAIAENRKEISIEDVTASPRFKDFILAGAKALFSMFEMTVPIDFRFYHRPDDAMTAGTDNVKCLVNTANPLFIKNKDGSAASLSDAYYRILGVLFHEMGHILFTDAVYANREMKNLSEKGIFAFPGSVSDEEKEAFDEIRDALKKSGTFRKVLKELSARLFNILEDGRIEERLLRICKSCAGFCRGLRRLRAFHFEGEDFDERLSEENPFVPRHEFEKSLGLMLYYGKMGKYPSSYTPGKCALFEECVPYIDEYMSFDEGEKLFEKVRGIIILFWMKGGLKDLFKTCETADESPEEGCLGEEGLEKGECSDKGGASCENSGTSSGAEGLEDPFEGRSPEEAKELIKAFLKALSEEESSPEPGYEGTAPASEKEAVCENAGEDTSEAALEGAIKQACGRKVEEEEIGSRAKAVTEAAIKHHNYENGEVHVFSPEEIRGEGRSLTAKELKAEVLSAVKKTAREINRHIVSDRDTGKKMSFSGRRFRASSVYKKDMKYFERKGHKVDTKKLAVAVRVDESGSMRRDHRCEAAKKASALLYLLSEEIEDLDIAIYGDTCCGPRFISIPYCDFGIVKPDALENISYMRARSGNNDALAVNILTDRLAEQPADQKVMISVSDGRPTECTEEELREAVKKAKKLGITVIAMAVGDDKELIKGYYGPESFCDITDLSALPKVFASLIKRRM